MTQGEWDRKHQRQEQRQRRIEIIGQVAVVFSVVAMLFVLYFALMAE